MSEHIFSRHDTLTLLDGIAYDKRLWNGEPGTGVELSGYKIQHQLQIIRDVIDAQRADPRHRNSDSEELAEFFDPVDEAFESLPLTDPEGALDLYEALATSQRTEDREFVARSIYALTKSPGHHQRGLEVWGDLLSDDEPSVSDTACRRFHDNLLNGETGAATEEMFAADGLTWHEAMDLHANYVVNLRNRAWPDPDHSSPVQPAAPVSLPES